MKVKVLGLTLVLTAALLAGCGAKPEQKPASSAPAASKPASSAPASSAPAASKPADVVATASVVNTNEAFKKGLTKDGAKYCLAILKDLTFTEELVVEGTTYDKDDKTKGEKRKIALYTQDEKKNVTARFTLKAPKITFVSNSGSLEHGTFVGDVYVSGKNFKLVNQKIEGNLYFLNEEAQKTFTITDKDTAGYPKSVVTGKQELKK